MVVHSIRGARYDFNGHCFSRTARRRGAGSNPEQARLRSADPGSDRGPIAKTLVRLAVPNMLVMLAQSAVGLIETYFVGSSGPIR